MNTNLQRIVEAVEAAAREHEEKARDLRRALQYANEPRFARDIADKDLEPTQAWYLLQRLMADKGINVGAASDPVVGAVRALAVMEYARGKVEAVR